MRGVAWRSYARFVLRWAKHSVLPSARCIETCFAGCVKFFRTAEFDILGSSGGAHGKKQTPSHKAPDRPTAHLTG